MGQLTVSVRRAMPLPSIFASVEVLATVPPWLCLLPRTINGRVIADSPFYRNYAIRIIWKFIPFRQASSSDYKAT